MIELKLAHNKGFQWYESDGIFTKGKCITLSGEVLDGEKLCEYFRNIREETDFINRINELNGLYSIVILRENKIMVAVDRLRNFPLFYQLKNGILKISDDYKFFIAESKANIDEEAKNTMLQLGYVAGNKTLTKDVFQLLGSQYLIFENQQIKINFYYKIHPCKYNVSDRQEWKKLFREKLSVVGERLSQMIGDNPVALPLSGGFDSRIIGLLLKLNHKKNVLCFSYGDPNNIEAKISKQVADTLNYPWVFINYNPYTKTDYIHSKQFHDYIDFAGNAVSFPYIQEYFAARYLKEELKLPENTIFIPGHSGDTLGGSHLFPDMSYFRSPEILAKKIIRTNGNLIPVNTKDKQELLRIISQSIEPEDTMITHLSHDHWNITERQSKQTVNSSKVWNYFGYKYLLPLWDNDLTDLFASIPFEFRVYKNFYNETLAELFDENGILFEQEISLNYSQKEKAYFKLRLKYLFPILSKLKKKNKVPHSFFYFEDLLQPMLRELEPFDYYSGNGILSAWYIKNFRNNVRP
ncbi:asparagine synthase [Bacteroidia bacterium]|nr:asparagine synthase [Bacteroidia bacterium]